MKHLIKIESTPHGVLGVRHAGLDQQYCEAGEQVILKWQPDAKWGLQEAHYTDGDGNVTYIDLTPVKIDGKDVVVFTMPAANITIGGTFKRFVATDWTENLPITIGISANFVDGVYKNQPPNSTTIVENVMATLSTIVIEDVFDGDAIYLKLPTFVEPAQYRYYFIFAMSETVAAINSNNIADYVEVVDADEYIYKLTAPNGTRMIYSACFKNKKDEVEVKKIVNGSSIDWLKVEKKNVSRELADYIDEQSVLSVDNNNSKFRTWDSIKLPLQFSGKKVTVFGDSIAAGIASPSSAVITDCFAKLFCDYAGVATLDNRAYSGATLAHKNNVTTNVFDRVTSFSDTTDIIIISAGTNDWNTGVQVGQWGSADNTTVYGAMKGICEYLATNYPTAVVIFITPIPYTKGAASYPMHNAELDAYRTAIYDVATYYGYNVVSGIGLGMPRQPGGWNNEIVADSDGCHPTARGHALMARNLCGKLL